MPSELFTLLIWYQLCWNFSGWIISVDKSLVLKGQIIQHKLVISLEEKAFLLRSQNFTWTISYSCYVLFIIEITWTGQIKSLIQSQQANCIGTQEWTLCTKSHKYYILEITLRYWEFYIRLNYWAVLEDDSIYISYMWRAWVLKSDGHGFKFQLEPLYPGWPSVSLPLLQNGNNTKYLTDYDWMQYCFVKPQVLCLTHNILWIVGIVVKVKKSGFAFYITGCLFPHKINSQSCIINFFFTLAFKCFLINENFRSFIYVKGWVCFKKNCRKKNTPLKFWMI